jgi:hypothetical protein
MRLPNVGLVFFAVMSWANTAMACPDCPTARAVQLSVLDHRFWSNLFLVSSPLVVLSLMGLWLYRLGDEP